MRFVRRVTKIRNRATSARRRVLAMAETAIAGVQLFAALDYVGLLDKEKNTPAMLSTGEQQRIGIARALVARPKLLIADEPTGNLDPDLSLDIMNLFGRFNEVGVTMLIATHDLGLVKQLGGRQIILEDGMIQENG